MLEVPMHVWGEPEDLVTASLPGGHVSLEYVQGEMIVGSVAACTGLTLRRTESVTFTTREEKLRTGSRCCATRHRDLNEADILQMIVAREMRGVTVRSVAQANAILQSARYSMLAEASRRR